MAALVIRLCCHDGRQYSGAFGLCFTSFLYNIFSPCSWEPESFRIKISLLSFISPFDSLKILIC